MNLNTYSIVISTHCAKLKEVCCVSAVWNTLLQDIPTTSKYTPSSSTSATFSWAIKWATEDWHRRRRNCSQPRRGGICFFLPKKNLACVERVVDEKKGREIGDREEKTICAPLLCGKSTMDEAKIGTFHTAPASAAPPSKNGEREKKNPHVHPEESLSFSFLFRCEESLQRRCIDLVWSDETRDGHHRFPGVTSSLFRHPRLTGQTDEKSFGVISTATFPIFSSSSSLCAVLLGIQWEDESPQREEEEGVVEKKVQESPVTRWSDQGSEMSKREWESRRVFW